MLNNTFDRMLNMLNNNPLNRISRDSNRIWGFHVMFRAELEGAAFDVADVVPNPPGKAAKGGQLMNGP